MSKDTDMKGAMFKNDDKKSDKHPDYRGSAMVDGVKYWVSCWVEVSKRGQKYFSMSYTKKDNQGDVPQPQTSNPPPDDPNDELPF